jgi:DNA-binding transcriptional LysR family regulator
MELRRLEHFAAVAAGLGFTRAAGRCGIATSALSASIRSLEHDLGATLFVRTTGRVALTEARHALLPYARDILAAAGSDRAAVDETRPVVRGGLAIGGIPTFTLLDMPVLLRRFQARCPKVDVRYTRGTSDTLIDEVRDGGHDVAVVSPPAEPPAGLNVIELDRGPVLPPAAPTIDRPTGRR